MESSIQSLSSDAFNINVDLWTAQAPSQRGPSGGFGTTEPGGYAVSYMINEDNMYFHIMYRRRECECVTKVNANCKGETQKSDQVKVCSAANFAGAVEKALLEMSVLCTKKAQPNRSAAERTLDWTSM
mmetsp:Transcript_31762/g.49693  ORF Transcript_31762/g.49693 Transcript_31762/m.49693 type:complete len:128 (+) Transcript_31762:2114-2497(+)